jgi:hypothetical protein
VELFVNKDILKALSSFLDLETIEDDILEMIIWIFANLFGDDVDVRMSICDQIPIHSKLKKIFEKKIESRQLFKISMFCFRNLTKNLDYEETYLITLIEEIILIIMNYVFQEKICCSEEVLHEVLEYFEIVTAKGNEYMVNALFVTKVYQKVISIIDDFENRDVHIIKQCIVILGNAFICENSDLTEQIVLSGVNYCFDRLSQNLEKRNLNEYVDIIRKLGWALANCFTISEKSINLILNTKAFSRLIDISLKMNNPKLNYEILHAVYQIFERVGSKESKMKLILTTQINNFLIQVIDDPNSPINTSIALDNIYLLLNFGSYELELPIVKKDLDNKGVDEKLKKLFTHNNDKISEKAVKIIEMFWS